MRTIRSLHASVALLVITWALAAGCATDTVTDSEKEQVSEDRSPAGNDRHCDLVAETDGDLAELSCLLDQPVNADGLTPEEFEASRAEEDANQRAACNEYYGPCVLPPACSVASGEGWAYVVCPETSLDRAWMRVCDGLMVAWAARGCIIPTP